MTNTITVIELNNQNGKMESYAVVANGLVYVSATYGNNSSNGELPEEFIDEANNAFKNLSNILQSSGSSCESAIKVIIYLTSYKMARTVNDLYSQFFSAPYIARLQMQVQRLPKDARISVEAIATTNPVTKIEIEK